MNKAQGKLVVISGPSGAGKSTVISRAMEYMENVRFSVSATTREPRTGERHGINYHFITKEMFANMIEREELMEYAEYVGNYYGTPKEQVFSNLREGADVILDIEVQGAKQVKGACPEAILVFLTPSSFSELEKRLRARNMEGEEKILQRLETAKKECILAKDYDYIIINDNVEKAARELLSIITAEKCRAAYRADQINKI